MINLVIARNIFCIVAMEQNFNIEYQSSTINVNVYGKGTKPVLCFHGYDEDATSFSFLAKAGIDFCFYSMDLPHHGQTNWVDEKVKPGLFIHIIEQVLEWHRATLNDVNKIAPAHITILGFSLGARMALSAYEHDAPKIERMVLLAPDGLKVNFWYWLATQTAMGNRLFLYTMHRPGWFFNLLKWMKKLGAVNQSVYRFVQYYIDNPAIRMLLYRRWTSLGTIKPDLGKIKNLIRRYHTPCRIVYGRHDRIILPGRGIAFCQKIESHCSIQMINAGHQVLHANHAAEIINALKQ